MKYLGKEKESIFDRFKKKYKLSNQFFCKLLSHKSFRKIAYDELSKSGVLKKIGFKNNI